MGPILQMGGMYERLKPYLLMTLAQIGYTLLYFITEASFNRGMNPHVYITYRHFVGGVVMLPFAYFLERTIRPKLTWALFLEIFVLSLLGVSLTLNMYFASLKYTSPAFVSSMVNTIASMTFVIAVLLKLEKLDVKSPRGMAKIVGIVVSLAGVTIMTLYKGAAIKNLWGAQLHTQGSVVTKLKYIHKELATASIYHDIMSSSSNPLLRRKCDDILFLRDFQKFLDGAKTRTILVEPSLLFFSHCFYRELMDCSFSLLFSCLELLIYRVWQDVPVLVMVSMLAYFCFLEQLLVTDMGSRALAISLPFSCVLGLLSSMIASTMAQSGPCAISATIVIHRVWDCNKYKLTARRVLEMEKQARFAISSTK